MDPQTGDEAHSVGNGADRLGLACREGSRAGRPNLTHSEQQEFLRLTAKSKGRPSNLSQRDRTRIKNIARKAIRG